MKRFYGLVVLMLLSSSAHAGVLFRLSSAATGFGSTRRAIAVHLPASQSRFLDFYETRRRRERNEENDAAPALASVPAKPQAPAPQPASLPAPATPPSQPSVEAKVAAPPSPPMQPVTPPMTPPALPATNVVASAAPATPPVAKVSREADQPPAETPLGDWRTEGGKGSVRIEPCGRALCGYVLDPSSNAVGESVLINMKPKTADLWSGNIYSRASGATYYATIAMKGTNSLRVEACALARFFCSANIWSRIVAKPQDLITSSQTSPEPRS